MLAHKTNSTRQHKNPFQTHKNLNKIIVLLLAKSIWPLFKTRQNTPHALILEAA